MNKNIKANILILIATILIALSFIISGKVAGIIDPISLTLIRFIIAFLCLLPILYLKKYRQKLKQSFYKGLKISLFYSGYFIILFRSLESTTALNTATLFTLTPLLTAIFSKFIFKNTLDIKQVLVYVIGLIATIIVIFDGDFDKLIHFSLNNGDILFLVGIIFMVFYSISAKYFYEEDDEVFTLTLMTLLGGIIWLSVALVLFGIPLEWEKLNINDIGNLLYLSIAATLVTVYLYQSATVVIGPKKIMAYTYINPAIVAIFLFAFEGVSISLWSIIGIFISCMATVILLTRD